MKLKSEIRISTESVALTFVLISFRNKRTQLLILRQLFFFFLDNSRVDSLVLGDKQFKKGKFETVEKTTNSTLFPQNA